MLTKILPILLAAVLALGSAACSGGKTAAEQQAEKEKAWRAKQRTRAIDYYTELAEKFPDSEYAPKAKERLTTLGAQPGAKPAGTKTTAAK